MTTPEGRFYDFRFTTNPSAIDEARAEAKKCLPPDDDEAEGCSSELGPKRIEQTDHDLMDNMIAAELVPAAAKTTALRCLTWPSGSGCPQANYVFWTMFSCARLSCHLPETDGQCPYDHTEVVRGYAAASQGVFEPEAVVQVSKDVDSQEDYDDIEYPILIQFIAKEKLYRFRAKQLGFIPDGYAVSHAVNRIISETGDARRFIEIDVQDLGGHVFANPKVLSDFCAKQKIHVYGFEEARPRKVESLPPIWDEWNDLMRKRETNV